MSLNPGINLVGISLWQPWASLFAGGIKRCETRGRPLPDHYHGAVLAVHAAEKMPDYDGLANTRLDHICRERFGLYWYRQLPRGAIVGTVRMHSTRPVEEWDDFVYDYGYQISSDEYAMGDYSPGRHFWFAEKACRLDHPLKFAGKQGFFKIPDRVAVQVLLAR